MKDDTSTPTPEAGRSPNEFERDKPVTKALTDAEAAIEALRLRGGVFVNAVRATRMPMVLTDPNLPANPIVFANESFLELSGYRMEEVLGQQPHFMNGPGTEPNDAPRFMEMLRSEQDGILDTVQYRKDGSAFVATVLLSAFKDENGRTLNHFMSWLDVTRRADAESEVAELKKTQAALRESEEKYRSLFDSMDEAYAVVEVLRDEAGKWADFRFIEVNQAFLTHTTMPWPVGKTATELLGTPNPRWTQLYGKALDTGEAIRVEEEEPRLGKVFDLNIFALDHEQNRVAVLFTDITKRKRAEDALRASEERVRNVLKGMDEAFGLLDHDLRIITQNKAALAIDGRPLEELRGRKHSEVYPNTDPAVIALYQRALAEGKPAFLEHRYGWHDGRASWLEMRAFPVPEGLAVFWRDISERKEAEEKLRESEEQLRLIVENAEDYAIFTTDSSGVVIDWRKGAELVFGYSAEEMIGQECDRLFTPEDRADGQPEKERMTAAERGKASDVRWHLRKDGTRVFIDGVSTALRDADGGLIGFLKIGQDVTEKHRASQKQATLLAELQHRVRNILALIRSVARRTSETTETMHDYVQHLEGRIGAMARTQSLLTRDIGSTVDLQNLLLDELEMQAAQPDQYRLTGPDVSLPGKAAEVLGLALHELATNSVKYGAMSTKDGRIDVRWTLLEGDSTPQLSLIWSEFGVDIDDGPRRYGFGTELITERVPYELHGTGTLEFEPHGIVATVEFPLAERSSILQTNQGYPDGDCDGSAARRQAHPHPRGRLLSRKRRKGAS